MVVVGPTGALNWLISTCVTALVHVAESDGWVEMGVLICRGNLDALVKVVVLCSGMEKLVMVMMMKKEFGGGRSSSKSSSSSKSENSSSEPSMTGSLGSSSRSSSTASSSVEPLSHGFSASRVNL